MKKLMIIAVLSLVASATVQAQEDKTDSLQLLTNEVNEYKSQLKAIEQSEKYQQIWKRKKAWKIGLNKFDIERTDGEPMGWKTDFSIYLQQNKTAYFHSKPIGGMVKFGIDFGFVDINYSKLKLNSIGTTGTSTSAPGRNGGSVSTGGFDEIVSEDPSDNILSMMGMDLGLHKLEYGLHVGPNISINPWDHIIISAYFHVAPSASCIIENDTFSYGFGLPMSAGVSVSYKLISIGAEGVWGSIKYKQTSFEENDSDDESSSIFGNTDEFKIKQKGLRFYLAFRF